MPSSGKEERKPTKVPEHWLGEMETSGDEERRPGLNTNTFSLMQLLKMGQKRVSNRGSRTRQGQTDKSGSAETSGGMASRPDTGRQAMEGPHG